MAFKNKINYTLLSEDYQWLSITLLAINSEIFSMVSAYAYISIKIIIINNLIILNKILI